MSNDVTRPFNANKIVTGIINLFVPTRRVKHEPCKTQIAKDFQQMYRDLSMEFVNNYSTMSESKKMEYQVALDAIREQLEDEGNFMTWNR